MAQPVAGDDPLGLRERSFGATVGFTLHPFFKNQWLVPEEVRLTFPSTG